MNILYGKTLEELGEICNSFSFPKYTAKQIANWLYAKQISEITEMTNLSFKARQTLASQCIVGTTLPFKTLQSKDGTKKYLFRYANEAIVEAVVIFDRDRATLCISSQAGCKLGCAFCATGQQDFKRNLTCGEILNIFRSVEEHKSLTNIVYMGMGEPLDNWQEVKKSIQILTSDWGYAMSPHRITVSTCGILPRMKALLEETSCDVAISLHNAIPNERNQIMPVEKAYPMTEIIKILRQYDWSGQRNLTFEYIVFEDINCKSQHIAALLSLLKGLPCHINLLRFHNIPNSPLKSASDRSIIVLRNNLTAKGLFTTIRASKGEDILAACGLLSGLNQSKTTFHFSEPLVQSKQT
jgi:23S rRNA (adenine2503-C2)-methyltransferase